MRGLGLAVDYGMPLPEAGGGYEGDTAPILLSHGNGVMMTGPLDAGTSLRARIMRGETAMSGLGMWEWLVGKPQSWYDRLNRAQNNLVVLQAQLEACPADLWKIVWDKKGQTDVSDRDAVKDRVVAAFRAITVTKDFEPPDAAITFAEVLYSDLQSKIENFKSLVPEAQAEIDLQKAKATAEMSKTELLSPGDVGIAEFERQVKERAKAMGAGVLDTLTIPLIAVAAIGLLILLRR